VSARVLLRDTGVDREKVPVLRGVHAEVAPGEWLAVIGPNGAGKSTLLKAVAGLLPYRGEISVDDRPVRDLSQRELGRGIAYTAQIPVVPPQMPVREYVLLGRTPHLGYLARPGRRDRVVADEVLRRLDLSALAERDVDRLSGGERQRVVLARALAQQARVLLLDEPTTALDLGHQQQVLEIVDALRRDDGLTVITTLHDLGVAAQYADRLLMLVGGRAVAAGTAAEVLTPASIAAHYQAHVSVEPGPDGRPRVHLVRPPAVRAAPTTEPPGSPDDQEAADDRPAPPA
jgi:iron complex transport system ATP-binding protein